MNTFIPTFFSYCIAYILFGLKGVVVWLLINLIFYFGVYK